MRIHITLGIATLALIISGCADMNDTQRRAATGAGVGAVVGAVLSSTTGGKAGTGAVVGAGAPWNRQDVGLRPGVRAAGADGPCPAGGRRPRRGQRDL